MIDDIPWTLSIAGGDSRTPTTFSATHWYRPSSLGRTSVIIRLWPVSRTRPKPVLMRSPLRFQEMEGSGKPRGGAHSMTAVSPAATLTFLGITLNSSLSTKQLNSNFRINWRQTTIKRNVCPKLISIKISLHWCHWSDTQEVCLRSGKVCHQLSDGWQASEWTIPSCVGLKIALLLTNQSIKAIRVLCGRTPRISAHVFIRIYSRKDNIFEIVFAEKRSNCPSNWRFCGSAHSMSCGGALVGRRQEPVGSQRQGRPAIERLIDCTQHRLQWLLDSTHYLFIWRRFPFRSYSALYSVWALDSSE